MEKIHFIGIGGIGMSGLAAIALAKGSSVTGSDLSENSLTTQLKNNGASISKGHSPENISPNTNLVVRSACIKDDNPEVAKAGELGIPVISRGEYLKRVMEGFPVSIAVTGTHGKTTTSALIAHILECCGKDPTVIVGGEVNCFGSNAKYGRGDVIVAEVDESDGTFQEIASTYALVTNIEREHMDHYASMDNVINAYKEFVGRVPPQGFFFYNAEDSAVRRLSDEAKCGKIDFGISDNYKAGCKHLKCERSIEFDFVFTGLNFGKIKSPLIGRYNALNLVGAIAVSMQMCLDFDTISEAVSSFSGIKRRFEVAGKVGNIEVIEDYAHHPTEISAVIQAAKDYGRGRIITVFQPHRYSRTRDLAQDFIYCFDDSDVLVLTDIYSAFEDQNEKAEAQDVFNRINKSRFEAMDFVKKEQIPEYVSGIARENDIVLVLGAGDIREVASPIVEMIGKSHAK
ncbi:MAG: UDP-N-acetylmuramate--L-alanine ligase [Candidatus Omnitrophota bacterium]